MVAAALQNTATIIIITLRLSWILCYFRLPWHWSSRISFPWLVDCAVTPAILITSHWIPTMQEQPQQQEDLLLLSLLPLLLLHLQRHQHQLLQPTKAAGDPILNAMTEASSL